jgi:pimeloyl-ACP methyl ester carboxylesterase
MFQSVIRKAFFLVLLSSVTLNSIAQSPAGFTEQEVRFFNGPLNFAATLFVPKGGSKYPALAITQGSGKDSRKDEGFRSLATLLAREGYVVLIYDKRGVGQSAGVYSETPDMALPAGDLIEAVRFLKTRKEVDPKKIGVYGHSQGGWVASLAAAVSGDISFLIVSCGGGVSIREQDLFNYSSNLRKQGYNDSTVASAIDFGRKLFTYLATEEGYGKVNEEYKKAIREPWFAFYKAMGFSDQLPPPSFLATPAFNFFKIIHYDPQSTMRALQVPTLVLLAGKDETVPSSIVKQKWTKAFEASGHAGLLQLEWLENENHYDFESVEGKVIYKKTFLEPLLKWMKKMN